MSVSFNAIPANFKVPLFHAELDSSQAGTPVDVRFALLTDYKIAAGTAVAEALIAVGSQTAAAPRPDHHGYPADPG